MSKPVAIGPQSRTVIGGDSPSVASVLKPPKKPFPWKKFAVPAGIAASIFLVMRYKGYA